MKKIMNHPENLVSEMCLGLAETYPDVEYLERYKIIKRKDINRNKVTLISGGGSGHEPAHAGFVGKGMLDAAVCGDIFASPTQVQIYQALKKVKSDKGTLMIVKNYSGDMMNFKNAAYMAKEDGIKVDYVKVDDDIAVDNSLYSVGRRGVAGTVFVHKIAGAAAERGMSLEEVKSIAEKVVTNTKSIGFALSSCTVPAKGTPTFELAEDEMEYGVGIHGEPGISREKMQTADELAERMTAALLKSLEINGGEEIALLVNGFGGTPLQELLVLNHAVLRALDERGVKVYRIMTGNYMTSIDMAGASVSILKLDKEQKELLDQECETPALVAHGKQRPPGYDRQKEEKKVCKEFFGNLTDPSWKEIKGEQFTLRNIISLVDRMGTCIIRNEKMFCEWDSYAGDGDFGMSIAKGFREIKREWEELISEGNTIEKFLDGCAMVLMEYCGGASGPIWGSAFRAAGKSAGERICLSSSQFAKAMQAAVSGIQKTGERAFGRGAVVGDKTLIDALVPCVAVWSFGEYRSISEAMKKGAEAAVLGAKSTENITAKMGRAGTVGERSLGYQDAGAQALGVIFTDLAQKR